MTKTRCALDRDLPPAGFITAGRVIGRMSDFGRRRIDSLSAGRTLMLGVMAGGFITAGALLSVLLSAGLATPAAVVLVEGLGFSTGFFFVVLSDAALFTEANVVMPVTLLAGASRARRVVRFWALAWIGNLLGAVVLGWLIRTSQTYPAVFEGALREIVATKMRYRAMGGAGAWLRIVLSGVLANWLVGMAAFFATMGRTIVGKYLPVLLAVAMFVAAGFQHSPANMGYFSISIAGGGAPGWPSALLWNIVPSGIGNMLGGTLLVALPFLWVYEST